MRAVAHLLDLRVGDLSDPPVAERVNLVTCPFRAYLHLHTDAERLRALRAARERLLPGGRLVFDVFAPGPDDIAETQRPLARARAGDLRARGLGHRAPAADAVASAAESSGTTMELAWLSPGEWQSR